MSDDKKKTGNPEKSKSSVVENGSRTTHRTRLDRRPTVPSSTHGYPHRITLRYTLPQHGFHSTATRSSQTANSQLRPGLSIRLPRTSETSTTKKIRPLRPVVASRLISRQIGGLRDPVDSEYLGLVDQSTRFLASYVKSMSTVTVGVQKKTRGSAPMSSWRQQILERYAELHDIPLTDIYTDYDIVFRGAGSRYQQTIYRQPRAFWLQKIEESGERNLESARQSIAEQEDDLGDVCCCPMFTTHMFAPARYLWKRYYKVGSRPKKSHFFKNLKETSKTHNSKNKNHSTEYNTCLSLIFKNMYEQNGSQGSLRYSEQFPFLLFSLFVHTGKEVCLRIHTRL